MNTSFLGKTKKAPQSRGLSAMLRRLAMRRAAQAMTAGALLALGAHSASADTTYAPGLTIQTSTSISSPTNLGALTFLPGASVEYVGPATIGMGNTAVAATGKFTTTTAGAGASGEIQGNTTGVNGADFATVGLYDFAATTGTTPFTIVGGSQVSGFYTAAVPGSSVVSSGNFDFSGTGGTYRITSSGANDFRFNEANTAFTINSHITNTLGGILVTPNVQAQNITFTTDNGSPIRPSGSSTLVGEIVVWQNNTQGELVFDTNGFISDSKVAGARYTQNGNGTVVFQRVAGNSFTGQSYLNGGVTEIVNNADLGTGTAATNLLGGEILASTNLSLDNGATASARPIAIGSANTNSGTGLNSSGTLAAVTNATLTVDGAITTAGTGGLIIGSGQLAGTGTGTANTTAVNGNGTVTITSANTFTGPTTVAFGTLNLTGTLGATPTTVNSGGTLSGTGTDGGAVTVAGNGTVSLTTGNSAQALTVNGATLGSTGTFGAGNYSMLNYMVGASGIEALNLNSAGLTLNQGGAFINIIGSAPVSATPYNLIINTGTQALTGAFSLSSSTAGVTSIMVGRNTESLNNTGSVLQLLVTGAATPGVAYFDGALNGNFNDLTTSTTLTNFSTDAAGNTNALNAPGATTDVILTASDAAAATQAPNENLGGANTTINSLTVNGNATNTITDTASLTINGLADTNTSSEMTPTYTGNTAGNAISIGSTANAFTINTPLVVGGSGAAQSYTNASASLFTVGKTLVGTATGGNTQTLTLNNTSTGGTTLGGVISDSGLGGKLALNINNTGAGVTTFGAANSYTGGTTITTGAVAISNNATLGTGAITLDTGSSIVSNYATGNRLTLSNIVVPTGQSSTITGSNQTSVNALSGGGTLNLISKAGGSTTNNPAGIVLAGNDSGFTGTLNLMSADTGAVTTLADFSLLDSNSGVANPTLSGLQNTTINLTNYARLTDVDTGGQTVVQTIGALTGDTTSVLAGSQFGGNHPLSIGSLNTNTTFNGQLGGVSNGLVLVKVGTGTLTLTNTTSNYTGGTTVSAGTLQQGATNVIGATTNDALAVNGGTFDLGGFNLSTTSLSGTGGSIINSGTGTSTLTSTGALSTTVASVIGGSGANNNIALTQSGSATLKLTGANTYTGGTTVSSGTLQQGIANAIGATTNDALAVNGGTFDLGGFSLSTTSLSGTGGSILTSSATAGQTLTSTSTGSTTVASVLGGAGTNNNNFAVTENGVGGVLTLANTTANTYTGGTTVSAGELDLNSATPNGAIPGNVTINGGTLKLLASDQIADTSTIGISSGTLNFNNFNETIFNLNNSGGTVIYGTGNVNITDPSWSGGTNTVSGNTTFGELTVSGGANTVTGTNSGGPGNLTVGGAADSLTGDRDLTFSGAGTPNITVNSDAGTPGKITLVGNVYGNSTGNGPATITSGGAAANPGQLDLNGNIRMFNVTGTGGMAISAQIVDSTGSGGAILKTGGSTLTLSGANTYTGSTTISAGELRLDNTGATSATGTGAVSETTGLLSGTGTSTGPLTVTGSQPSADGSTPSSAGIAPGDNPAGTTQGTAGTLSLGTTSGATLNDATLYFDLSNDGTGGNGITGTNDKIITSSALSLGNNLSFNFYELNPTLDTTTDYTIIATPGATGAPTGSGTASSFAAATTIRDSSGAVTTAYRPTFSLSSTGLTVHFDAAPEPGQTATMSLIGIGMLGLFGRAYKRRKMEQATG